MEVTDEKGAGESKVISCISSTCRRIGVALGCTYNYDSDGSIRVRSLEEVESYGQWVERVLLGLSRLLLISTSVTQIVSLLAGGYFLGAISKNAAEVTGGNAPQSGTPALLSDGDLVQTLDGDVWVVNIIHYTPIVTVIAALDIVLDIFGCSFDVRAYLRGSFFAVLSSVYLAVILPIVVANAERPGDIWIAVLVTQLFLLCCYAAVVCTPLPTSAEELTPRMRKSVGLLAVSLLVFIQVFAIVKDILFLVVTYPDSEGAASWDDIRVAVADHLVNSLLTLADMIVSLCTLIQVYHNSPVEPMIDGSVFLLGMLQYTVYSTVLLVLPVLAPLCSILLLFVLHALYVMFRDSSACCNGMKSFQGFENCLDMNNLSTYYASVIAGLSRESR